MTAAPPWRRKWTVAAALAVPAIAVVAFLLLRTSNTPEPLATPAPAAPAPPPQQEAIVTSPATLAPAPPAPPATPAPPAPAPPPQQEAIVAPPAIPAPAPQSPLEQALDAAQSLPCAALRLSAEADTVHVSGFAAAEPELGRFLADLKNVGRVADHVTRIDRLACPVLAILAPVIRSADSGAPALALRLDHADVASGGHIGISVATALPATYVDLYQSDGSVRHLLRGASTGKTAEWFATPPAGSRLIVAIGAGTALDVGQRPETERAADYLDVLRTRLNGAAAPLATDLAMVIVRAAEPAPARPPQPRPAAARSEKCANIVNRAQLGETLSDAELAALRTECRS